MAEERGETDAGDRAYTLDAGSAIHQRREPHPALQRLAAPPSLPDLQITDVLCVECSYNLRGLDPGAACPECAALIERSLHGDRLQYSSQNYLHRLHRGILLVESSIAGLLIAMILAFLLAMSSVLVNVDSTVRQILKGLFLIAITTLPILMLIGWWFFTTPDPRMAEQRRHELPRKIVRVSVYVSAGAILFGIVQSAGVFALSKTMTLLGEVLLIVSLFAWLVLLFASLFLVQQVAKRAPNERVAKRAVLLMWLGPVLTVAGFMIFGFGFLITIVLYWTMLHWLRKELRSIRLAAGTNAIRAAVA